MKVAVVGAGAFGCALAKMFAERGHETFLWTRQHEVQLHFEATGRHLSRFVDQTLPRKLTVVTDAERALKGAQFVVSAVPMEGLRATWGNLKQHLEKQSVVVSVVKGIEQHTHLLPLAVLKEVLDPAQAMIALSGPSFASEIMKGLPWACVIASEHADALKLLQQAVCSDTLKVYLSDDVLGVEIGGAMKNVIAIAAGVADGMHLGANARAALITRGLAEIKRLAQAMGAKEQTLYGMSGLGDLLLTCTSKESRNFRVGLGLAQHQSVAAIKKDLLETAEGINTAASVRALAARYGVHMSISDAVYRMLFEGLLPKDALSEIMSRKSSIE